MFRGGELLFSTEYVKAQSHNLHCNFSPDRGDEMTALQ